MLKVAGDEAAAQREMNGQSLLDEIAREGARRMLVAALESGGRGGLALDPEVGDAF